MLAIVYTILLSCIASKEPPVKLIAFKQINAPSIPKMEVTMNGEFKINQNQRSYRYLIWLATKELSQTKIISVRINNKAVFFDTSHISQPITIEKTIKEPMGEINKNLFEDNTASYIRIYIKEQISGVGNAEETITVRFKKGTDCTKKMKKSIEVLPVSITE
ncbi:MAG: hypothetical protein ACO23V_02320 [Chitinophagaceae bacterium]